MTYSEALDFLFTATPVFQQVGGSAYKPGLERMQALDEYWGHPHRHYKTIHVGGTNGKGSTSHTLAAILQEAGYRVGLFTSPHLVDFRERIRVNGQMISQDYVCAFTEEAQSLVLQYQPSFFELTSMMALKYFADEKVDIAIIEVGLGGRLDSTNIISPLLSIITNISFDHTQYLGNTLEAIAHEKAGIIKSKTPIVIGQAHDPIVRQVFEKQALRHDAPISFAEESQLISSCTHLNDGYHYSSIWGEIFGQLAGEAQQENTQTIVCALDLLREQLDIPFEAIQRGFAHVVELTGLQGRWQTLSNAPKIICDTGHNEAGIRTIVTQLKHAEKDYPHIHVVLGMASDKDVHSVLKLFPKKYHYYWTKAQVSRALPEQDLKTIAESCGLVGEAFSSIDLAVAEALVQAEPNDLIFVGGSNFVVADLLVYWHTNNLNN